MVLIMSEVSEERIVLAESKKKIYPFQEKLHATLDYMKLNNDFGQEHLTEEQEKIVSNGRNYCMFTPPNQFAQRENIVFATVLALIETKDPEFVGNILDGYEKETARKYRSQIQFIRYGRK